MAFQRTLKHWKHHRWGIKLGFTIHVNTCGKGLYIPHWGSIVINEGARIGDNLLIQIGANIGQNYTDDNVPTIGDNVYNVYIGPGAKIFGKITIANGVAIGANSVVNKSITEENVSVAGIPARIIGPRKPGLR